MIVKLRSGSGPCHGLIFTAGPSPSWLSGSSSLSLSQCALCGPIPLSWSMTKTRDLPELRLRCTSKSSAAPHAVGFLIRNSLLRWESALDEWLIELRWEVGWQMSLSDPKEMLHAPLIYISLAVCFATHMCADCSEMLIDLSIDPLLIPLCDLMIIRYCEVSGNWLNSYQQSPGLLPPTSVALSSALSWPQYPCHWMYWQTWNASVWIWYGWPHWNFWL